MPTTSSAHLGRVESPERRLEELGIELPSAPGPLGPYPVAQVVGDLLYTTGILPVWNGELRHRGALGSEVGLAEGAAAARLCGLNLLALIRECAGSLDNVRQVVQVVGLVLSAPAFAQQSKVLNGISELLYGVFGQAGRHNRTALATAELPLGATVQVTAVVRIDLGRLRVQEEETTIAVAGSAVDGAEASEGGDGVRVPVNGAAVERVQEREGSGAGGGRG